MTEPRVMNLPNSSPPISSCCAPACSLSSPCESVEKQVRIIQKTSLSMQEKSMRIHDVFVKKRRKIRHRAHSGSDGQFPRKSSRFPGIGAPAGCKHYSRKCWIRAECCQKYYPCRRCHDEAEDHEIDRTATKIVACVTCGDSSQPVAKYCRTCGTQFAEYFCEPCRLYDDSKETKAYHCDKCGICRAGKGLNIDNYHCDKCNTCIPIESKDNHPCRNDALHTTCPICHGWLATSTSQVIFLPCEHPIHVDCLEKYLETNFTCPLCSKNIHKKSIINRWYNQLEASLLNHAMPKEYACHVAKVLCNDCNSHSVARFHFQYHRCQNCFGYNTRLLDHYDVDPADMPPPLSLINRPTKDYEQREHVHR